MTMRLFASFATAAAMAAALGLAAAPVSATAAGKVEGAGAGGISDLSVWAPKHPYDPVPRDGHKPGYHDHYEDKHGKRHGYASCPRRPRHPLASTIVSKDGNHGRGVYDSISKAICHTAAGGTVFIKPGVYAETLTIEFPVRLKADSRRFDQIDASERVVIVPGPAAGDAPGGVCAIVDAEGEVEMENLWFSAENAAVSQACLELHYGTLILKDSAVTGNPAGAAVYLVGGSAVLDHNRIMGGQVGVLIAGRSIFQNRSDTYVLRRNEILNNQTGIVVDADLDVDLIMNAVTRNAREAIRVGKGNVEVLGNEIFYNDGHGIVSIYPRALLIENNNIGLNGAHGIYLPLSLQARIRNNTIACNRGFGIEPEIDSAYRANRVEFNPPDYFEHGGYDPERPTGRKHGYDQPYRSDVCQSYDFYGLTAGR